MPVFLWEAKDRLGTPKSGEMEAASADAVTQRLRNQRLQVEKVKKKPIEIHIRMPGATGVTTKDLVVFTRQFATMIDAGLPIVQCLDILSSQLENQDFKKILLDVKNTVESGATLAEALSKHPKVFNKLFVNLVAAGEAGGVLDTILSRLAVYLEKNMKLVKQIKGAMTYPAITLAVSAVITVVILVFVIPTFQSMFESFGSSLPAPTQFVVNLSNLMRNNALLLILGSLGFVVGFKAALSRPKGRAIFDRLILQAPIFGELVRKVAVAKFTRTMSTMLSSGVNILDALDIVAATAGNTVVEAGLLNVKKQISEGKTMAAPLAQIPVFPSMVVQMISVGESTGAMDTMLGKIADFYDDEVDAAIGTMMGMIEPVLMIMMAVVLGGLVMAMYLPIFTLAGAVQ